MKKQREGARSLKWGIFTTVALCWVVPIVTIVTVAGFLLNQNYEKQLLRRVETATAHAMEQVEFRLTGALEDSKGASYDGDIRAAYRAYEEDGDQVALYSRITDYLSRRYARHESFQAVFLTFLDQPDADYSYVVAKEANSYLLRHHYHQDARDVLLETAAGLDTEIVFREIGGRLYMVRNLLNTEFRPYAVLAMLCDPQVLFQSLQSITSLTRAEISLDGTVLPLREEQPPEQGRDYREVLTEFTASVGDHTLTFRAVAGEKNLWGAMPELRGAILLILLLVIPVLLTIFTLFYRHITHPMETLVHAADKVQAGQRGYQITELPRNMEFRKLTRHFNAMSKELKSQFDRLYLEQQALQEARIKALQSQINPHFLGNTLEIINWEARLADDEKVSLMIEALSTMMDAAIGRDGRSQVSLREELSYVDAYLYIIQQRMGENFHVEKDIDQSLLDQSVPRLLLQPLAENAVEHDIARGKGSGLWIRVFRQKADLILEVEHEGSMSEEDQKKVEELLSHPAEAGGQKGQVGIRNLNQRLKLLYAGRSSFAIREVRPGRVLARISLPLQGAVVSNWEE